MKKVTIIAITDKGIEQALILQKQFPKSLIITTRETTYDTVSTIPSIDDYLATNFSKQDAICFISAMGICVRSIAPYIEDKTKDPAIICVDDKGVNVQSVLSGHQGGANEFAQKGAQLLGGNPIISTSSDVQNIWSLDLLADQFNWTAWSNRALNEIIALFVNNKKTALLLDVKDQGTIHLEKTTPHFVECFYTREDIDIQKFELLIAVTYKTITTDIPTLTFYPKCLHLGTGCSKELDSTLFDEELKKQIAQKGIAFEAIASIGSIDIKANQQAYLDFAENNEVPFHTFTAEKINTIQVPNPSEKVQEKIGVDGVSESTAMLLSANNNVLIEKQKNNLENGQKFTYSIAIDAKTQRKAQIAIIGAGPGDEELITVKGKNYLQTADCVLYAGSLIPEEMTSWCKKEAIVRNSAMMTLEEQVNLMQDQYKKGNFIVRLQSGDPSLYGAIQEQMTIFDELGMDYFIVPGISAFSAQHIPAGILVRVLTT